MERYIAIDNVCAWPNLTQLPNGDIVAAIFNKPFHGLWVGDVECWASVDGGRLWSLRGVPAPHEPGTNRMNVAAGVAKNGDLLVIASGWNKRKEHPPKKRIPLELGSYHRNAEVLAPWVCRSRDGGKTWKRTETVICEPAGVTVGQATPIPFGDIHIAGPKLLVCSMYFFGGNNQKMKFGMPTGSYCFRSRDDGKTWGEPSLISNQHNETTILCLDKKRWLAAARSDRLDLFVTDDAGEHWGHQEALTSPDEFPAHLLRLRDGRVVLTFGIRHTGFYGIGARVSEDQGKTWSSPTKLVDFGDAWDGGYPSSVETSDGTLVTAYYTPRISQHQRYHMGAILWKVEEAYARNLRKDDEY